MNHETSVILGYPKTLPEPFDWSTLDRPQYLVQTVDDLVELFEQIEFQHPSDVVIQADAGLVPALKLCRLIVQRSRSRVHLVSRNVTSQQATAARSIGVTSFHDAELGYDGLTGFLTDNTTVNPGRKPAKQITIGTLTIYHSRRRVEVGDNALALTKTEFEILFALAARPRELVNRQDLTRHVWGEGWYGAPNVLDTHLTHLRAKLAAAGHRDAIITVYRTGFYFEPQSGDATRAYEVELVG